MKKVVIILVAIIVYGFMLSFTLSKNSKDSKTNYGYFKDRIYVVYKADVAIFWDSLFKLNPVDFPEIRSITNEFNITEIENSFYFSNNEFLKRTLTIGFSNFDKIDELITILSQNNRIRLAEKVPIMRTTLVPNDPSYSSSQAALTHINAEAAWDITTGSGAIDVAVVDDAIDIDHPDLVNVIDMTWDISDNDPDPSPPNINFDHGTHVAGIVSAESNNGIGIASIGFGGVDLIAIKASDGTTNNDGEIIITHGYQGIAWAAQNGVEVINCSWGGTDYSIVEQTVINDAWNQGAIIVAAAGNDNTDQPHYPAGYDNVISVASSTLADEKSSFSNFGSQVDITAPGSSIFSTEINNDYGFRSGTSMASPMVAGLIGLVWSINLNLSQEDVIACVTSTAVPLSWEGGSGRINAAAAVQCVGTGTTWVDYNWNGMENGNFNTPYNTVIEAVNVVTDGGTIFIKSSVGSETITINENKSFAIRSWNGVSIIGQ